MATIEEAQRCPKCGFTGREDLVQPAANRDGKVYTYKCVTATCPWYETGWTVQVKANGEIPTRDTGNVNKQFHRLTAGQEGMASRQIEDAKRQLGIKDENR